MHSLAQMRFLFMAPLVLPHATILDGVHKFNQYLESGFLGKYELITKLSNFEFYRHLTRMSCYPKLIFSLPGLLSVLDIHLNDIPNSVQKTMNDKVLFIHLRFCLRLLRSACWHDC